MEIIIVTIFALFYSESISFNEYADKKKKLKTHFTELSASSLAFAMLIQLSFIFFKITSLSGLGIIHSRLIFYGITFTEAGHRGICCVSHTKNFTTACVSAGIAVCISTDADVSPSAMTTGYGITLWS